MDKSEEKYTAWVNERTVRLLQWKIRSEIMEKEEEETCSIQKIMQMS